MRDQEFVEMLAKRENFGCAMEVSRAIEDVKLYLQQKFWKHVKSEFDKSLDDKGLGKQWKVEESIRPDNYDDYGNEPGIYFVSKQHKDTSNYIQCGVWYMNSRKIGYGICFSQRLSEGQFSIASLIDLRQKLKCKSARNFKDTDDWYVWKNVTDNDPMSDEFLYHAATDAQDIAKQLSEEAIEIIEEHGDQMLKVENDIS